MSVSLIHTPPTTYNSRVQPHISLCELTANKELSTVSEYLFKSAERLKERLDICLISLLTRCEPALVDAVVDGVVDPFIEFIEFTSQVLRIQIAADVQLEVVQETNNFTRFIRHDRLELVIPNNWHCVSSGVLRVCLVVQITNSASVLGVCLRCALHSQLCVDTIDATPGSAFIVRIEGPALLAYVWVHYRHWEKIIETFECSDDECSVRPWTCVGYD